MNVADYNCQHLSPRVGLHTTGAAVLQSKIIRETSVHRVSPKRQRRHTRPWQDINARALPDGTPCAAPRPRAGFGLPHLRGGEGAFRPTPVAEPDLDFDDAVAPDARAHGKRQATEDELEMRNLQPLRRKGDLAIGGEAGRVEMDAHCQLGVGGGAMRMGAMRIRTRTSLNASISPPREYVRARGEALIEKRSSCSADSGDPMAMMALRVV